MKQDAQITIRNPQTGETIVSFRDEGETVRPSLHIEGRRWFRRGPGHTLHTTRIFLNGKHVHTTPMMYGYGDQFLQSAAAWLCKNGFPQLWNDRYNHPALDTRTLREDLGGTYSVIDVSRQRDL